MVIALGITWVLDGLEVTVAGSIAGAALTFWMGVKIGEKGLDRWVPERRLDQIRSRLREKGAVALAILDLVPPPFPFTLSVLAAGALEVDMWTFFVTLLVCRIFRFGLEALLAIVYGRSILSWLESDLFYDIVMACVVLAVVLTTGSLIKIVRTSGRPKGRRVPA